VVFLAGIGLLAASGCGRLKTRPHEINGQVELTDGDVRQLTGGHVEAILVSDPRVQATGEISDDGSFSLQTVRNGELVNGVRDGEYLVRIVLSDEDSGYRLRRGAVLAHRYTQFKTSGLSIKAPPDGPVIVRVSSR
jgi:hypothetical protein